MPQIKLTRRNIDRIELPLDGQLIYRDTELPGFGLRVGKKSRSFFVERQIGRKTMRRTIGNFPIVTPELAREEALVVLRRLNAGDDPLEEKRKERTETITLDEAAEAFFEGRTQLKPFTVDTYRRSIDLHLSDWRNLPMREITRQMVMERHQRITRQVSGVSANNVMRHLRSIYNYTAAAHDGLGANPCQVLTQARAWAREQRRQSVIPAKHLPAWWRAVWMEDDQPRDFMLVAIFTGMRSSEIKRLRWEDVDPVAETLTVPQTKNGDPLVLPLSTQLARLFKDRRARVQRSPWVFPGKGPNKTGHIKEVKSIVRRVRNASGVHYSMHDLRRTFITIAEGLDIPAFALKRLLNHRIDTDVTGGYIVMDAERLREPAQRVADRIMELVNNA
ncbi:tyrosine-type recombinase/integrase [Hyphobacterium sp.]|uniref:tyrosine-type recombinase/integrase n=1 Tax=Hyphobacterium sp. TaxID=2004662 RepID=UPI0037493BE1